MREPLYGCRIQITFNRTSQPTRFERFFQKRRSYQGPLADHFENHKLFKRQTGEDISAEEAECRLIRDVNNPACI